MQYTARLLYRTEEETVMNEFKNELNYYSHLNSVSAKGGVVLFGSTFAKSIPVTELSQSMGADCCVYNRSFCDLSVFDAAELCEEAVMKTEPKKVLIQLGETDIERGYKSVNEIISAYESLIAKIRRSEKKVKIVVMSVCSDEEEAAELNSALESMAGKCRCQYADVTGVSGNEIPAVKAFRKLRCFIPDRLSFCDAMSFA